jgi:predicted DCC family thiol-disulfide oxidoreductase YuxK
MKNGWTGGQYSIFRAIFGVYLFVHFAQLAPWTAEVFSSSGQLPQGAASPILHFFPNVLALCDTPAFVSCFVALGAGLSLLVAAGIQDRWAAVGTWYVWACLLGRNPLIANPSIPYVGWMLLAHAALPRPCFGAWVSRGRVAGELPWRMPPALFAAAWIVMALGYSYSGVTKLLSPSWQDGSALLRMLGNPLGRPGGVQAVLLALPPILVQALTWSALSLELLFAPLSLIRRLRPWLWGLLLAMHLLLIVTIDFADLSLGMVMLHLFTFDPAWIAPRRAGGPALLHYDGACAFCHGFVRFVLAEDASGGAFRFAPLAAGDTLIVQTGEGRTLTRSTAVLEVLERLGGVWRPIAVAGRLVPRVLRDAGYDAFARVRRRLFPRPEDACPVLPAALRARFVSTPF